eukprot:TRINITY_DN4121_c1_g1_i3.p1 TRINITY_DN4121_c1_g1~~TRINITY_DN4121_c1_g1_i3.p1  ORF type:complete len:464 (-),score=57.80 TRINITY_DN4121_c1_g1_i3:214-1605(-)
MAKLINRDLFDLTRTHSFEEHASLAALVRERIGSQGLEEVDIDNFLTQFRKAAKKKWHSAGCHIRNMESKFGTPAGWLNQVVDFGGFIVTSKRKATPKKGVAPKKEFGNLSRSQQNRSTANLRAENESSKLLHAAKTALRNDGKEDMAVVIEEASKSPTRPSKIRRLSGIASSLDKAPPRDLALPTKISDDDALAHLFYTDMTRDAYVANRLMCKSHGADIWPPYGNLQEAKKLCRPANITYEECAVIVPLRERLLHNDGRFVQVFYDQIEEHLQNVEDGGTLTIEVEEKIGFDGSTGNSIYNQKFGSNDPEACEESLLSTCLVPLQYRTSNGQVIFTNPVPQGVTFCQPVRLEYKKETQAASKQIDNWIDAEVAALAEDPIIIPYATKFLKFLHTLRKTMMDVKAKKDSRLHTIQDQFHRQSDKSDISMALKLQEKQKKKRPTGELPRDVLELLIPAQEPDV